MTTAMPHHPDEVLSAVLDGESSREETTHVAGCDSCQSRLELLRAAALAIAEVPPVDPEHRRARVQTAVRRGAARVVPGGAGADDVLGRPAGRRQPPAWVVAAGSIAAAVAVFFGLAALLSSDTDDLTGPEAPLAAAGPDAGFLGSFDDGQVLARELENQLGVAGRPRADDSTNAGGFFAPEADGADRMEATSEEAGDASAGALAESGPSAGSQPRLTDAELTDCAEALDAEFPDRGEPLLVARVVWRSEPAAVFVHRVDSGADAFRAWIYAGDPCTMKTFLSF